MNQHGQCPCCGIAQRRVRRDVGERLGETEWINPRFPARGAFQGYVRCRLSDVARFPALGKHLFRASGTHLGFLRRWGPLVPAYSRVSDNCHSNNGTLNPSTYFGFRRRF